MIEATTAIQRLPEDVLIIIPVRDVVLFPNAILPISVGREKSILGVQEAMRSNRQVGVILQRDAKDNDPDEEALHKTGTTANILRYLKSSEGSINMLVTGDQRFRILQFLPDLPFLVARIELVTEPRSIGADISARARYLKQRAEETLQLLPNEAGTFLASALIEVSDAGVLADGVTARMDIPPDEKQKVLDAIDLKERLDRVIDNLSEYLNVLRLYREIEDQTRGKFNAEKRERILREQLETIRHELGDDGQRLNGKDFQHVIDEAEMPEAVANEVKKEAARLMRTNEQSPEYAMLRTWIELMVELPWNKQDEENIDITHARAVLDADHYGMEKVKRRILEFLAVKKLKPRGKSPILCLVGPPGVGKTSLGKSIARAIGVKFTRTSLGGVHDEAEIRGHRRTYIGALSGVVIRNLHKCGSRNPVFMLDEIDKMGYGVHGDPASALLEVLDPEQNFSFVDNYLGLPFDLSSVFFIATANVIDAIPVALSDRMEVIEIPGYTAEEKLEIAKRYLVSRQQEENGLQANQAVIDDDALKILIESYTREAGVRNLERQISALLRNAAVQIAEGKQQKIRITKTEANDILGPYIFEQETAMLAGKQVWLPGSPGRQSVAIYSLLKPRVHKEKGNSFLPGSWVMS